MIKGSFEPTFMNSFLAPIEILGASRQGQSLPMLMRCYAPERARIDPYFVKVASKRTSQPPEVLATEYLSMLVCNQLGLSILDPFVVHLTSDITADLARVYGLEPEDTFAFALDYVENLTVFNARKHFDRIAAKVRARILVLDVMLSNGDRVPENPNLAWEGTDLFVFDFGACCNFRPMAVDNDFENNFQSGLTILKSHVLFEPKLKAHISSEFNWILRAVDSDALARQSRHLPGSWHNQARLFVEYIG